eukprot:c1049_g1_i1.p1 GENE.c1049_g1_i1~~c1049_g1_i1.p1  ORF type:complete len:278 (-),score=65.90 c1049_g1_i1:29-817(-)
MDNLAQLQFALSQTNVNTEFFNTLWDNLKLELLSLSVSEDSQSLLRARSILEVGTLYTAQTKQFEAFERHFAQLRVYYWDFRTKLPASEQQWLITGLYLLHLLTQNRISEFHSELELIPIEAHTGNEHIKHSVEIEQAISEGAYQKMLKELREESRFFPSGIYRVFMEDFLSTIRQKIARCSEKAYETLTVAAAQQLLMFDTDSETRQFVEECQWGVVPSENGDCRADKIVFAQAEPEEEDVQAKQLMIDSLHYAKELEAII